MRAFVTGLSLLSIASSCRTSQRPNVSTENPTIIDIRMNGMDATDASKYQLTAQLKLCAETSGSLSSDTTYRFSVYGIKKDTVCQIRMVGAKAADAGVSFFPGTDEGVYYDATTVTIRQNETGALIADAFLQKHFSTVIAPSATTWKMIAPLKSESQFNATCTCRITCSPKYPNDAALVQVGTTATEGQCIFDNPVGTSAANASCSQMIVQCGDKIFAGSWASPVSAQVSAGKTNTFPSLTVLAATLTPEGDVVITPQINKTGTGLK